MVAVTHLVGPAALSSAAPNLGLSVLSYNVLLPNSVDGWWLFKMYSPPLAEEQSHMSSWEYRRELLKFRISLIDADVVCLQEVAPVSFEEDFRFMQELGYDGMELFRKGRFRPATFWKTSKVELACEPVHKDRTLLTAFRLLSSKSEEAREDTSVATDKNWYVLNCHLQAAKQAPRRLRQINEGVRAAMTLARKQNEETPEESIRLVVCGDFNGGPECAAVRYLEDGEVDSNFVEDGETVTSGKKQLPLSAAMQDAVAAIPDREPPPSLVVAELLSLMVEEGTGDDPRLSSDVRDRLGRAFDRYASHIGPEISETPGMDVSDVEKWLMVINRRLGRGSEFQEAAREMGWKDPSPDMPQDQTATKTSLPTNGILTKAGFLHVYENELRSGKFWGIAHDLAAMGESLPYAGMFTARYDRLYCSAALRPTCVLDTLCNKPCPNDVEPSDHLPVAAAFTLS